jgi:hypothetical protein
MWRNTLWFTGLLIACGGVRAESRAPPGESGTPASPEQGGPRDLAGALVYDAKGNQKTCDMPVPTCPEPARDRAFLDRCVLAGYQVRRCGCELVCSGHAMVEKSHYDAQGKPRRCEAERKGCSPPETSAKFQDACTDGGHQLVVCGCEWLCTGPLKEPAGAAD